MPPIGSGGMRNFRSFTRGDEVRGQHITPGTIKRIIAFGSGYYGILSVFLLLVVLDAITGVINPLLYRVILDNGVLVGNVGVVIKFSLLVGVVVIADSALTFFQRGISMRIGQNMLLDMRARVFKHIQKMSLAFFTRTRTGALVSRLNTDVAGINTAFTDILSTVISNFVTTVLTLGAMFFLSWRLTLVALVLIPVFVVPARFVGKKLQKLTRESYDISSEMYNMMIERFNVAGAQLAKVFGEPEAEEKAFNEKAKRVRDIAVKTSNYSRIFFVTLGLVASLAVAVTYGWGGVLTIRGLLDVGTLVAMASYLTRLYGPLTALSNVQVDIMTALVSFDRVFEILDLKPMVEEKKDAVSIPPAASGARIEFDHVDFRYPSASEISLASLESVAVLSKTPENQVLHDLNFVAEPAQLVALVGHSGAGKTTITQLIPRFYDTVLGSIRINGVDVRDATFGSLREMIGMVMQEAHMFHDTIRANLVYAKPNATEAEITEALRGAQILPLIESLPQGIDTVIGDRGYRLSGGEKQRIAIARVLLKAPAIVILDEATAHLDSESEAAIQKAFQIALKGRTSIVIAHRLSTIRNADQILVIEKGTIVEHGKHETLLKKGKMYAQLYKTQFAEATDTEDAV
jgi:ATP-binding cassette subfamily B protein